MGNGQPLCPLCHVNLKTIFVLAEVKQGAKQLTFLSSFAVLKESPVLKVNTFSNFTYLGFWVDSNVYRRAKVDCCTQNF